VYSEDGGTWPDVGQQAAVLKNRKRQLAVEEDPSVGNDAGSTLVGLHKHESVGLYVHKGEVAVIACGAGAGIVAVIVAGETFDSRVGNAIIPLDRRGIL
jgi:hypothetical protein